MKVIFFNRFFHPDTSATSQILSDLAFELAARHEVHVVASRAPGGAAGIETIRGVTVHRVAEGSPATHSLLRRAFAYIDYYRGARKAASELVKPGDVVVLKTDPPMLGAAVGRIAVGKGGALVNWLQDLFPEVAQRYGIPGAGGLSGAILRGIRNRSLRLANRVVVIGERMAGYVKDVAGVPGENIAIIHNWADGEQIRPMPAGANRLRDEWGLAKSFVVGYSGNLGRVHEFDTLLDAAARLRETDPDIVFAIVGRGPRLQEVRDKAERARLTNVHFHPHQEQSALSTSLAVPDVHVSTLRPDFEALVHPSKLYGVMAAGRPTLFIGDSRGETARILAETDAGVTVATGEGERLAATIRQLRDDPGRCRSMGQSAREAFELLYDRPVAIAKWEALLKGVGA